MIEKQAFYRTLNQQAQALLEGEPDLIANLANLSALLNQELADINWVGFYLLQGETLVLGPFQGKPACVRIPVGRGVCRHGGGRGQDPAGGRRTPVHGSHRLRRRQQFGNRDSAASRWWRSIGVLDVDSPIFNRFDQEDRIGLEETVQIFGKHALSHC